jgi:glutathione S-transferase
MSDYPGTPGPAQSARRARRTHSPHQLNDLESLPYFLVAGFLFVLTGPSLLLARGLLHGYVVSRLLHSAAYLGACKHQTRATLWSVGSLILGFMACWILVAALRF